MQGGWWLQLYRDRPATIGFGALPHWISVKDGTFSLDAVYDEIVDAIAASHHGAPVIATFGSMLGDEERGFGVVGVDALVDDLFARAYRQRDQDAVGPFRQQDRDALEPFWADAPFLQ